MRNLKAHALRERERRRLDAQDQEWAWASQADIHTVLDIGANTGQFAQMIHRLVPDAAILSFEPLKDCYDELERNLSAIPGARAFNVALGDAPGDVEMNRSDFTPSSSLLSMAELHKRNWPQSVSSHREAAELARLDDVLCDVDLGDRILVKIDVQGYEGRVIAGGRATLSRAAFVVVETAIAPLYVGQPVFDEVYRGMCDLGFEYRGNLEQVRDKENGRIICVDAVFENAGHREGTSAWTAIR